MPGRAKLGLLIRLAALLCTLPLFAQQKSDSLSALTEFPVNLRQNIAAGKTAVGTKIQARLVIATLFEGVVLPRDAEFSGEVVESAAKTKDAPSRLSLRWNSVRWKGGSKTIKLYLTTWYYPPRSEITDQDSQPSGIHGSVGITLGGGGYYPPPLYPDGRGPDDSDPGSPRTTQAPLPSSAISEHRIQMKDVESVRGEDGAITLTSSRRDLKLDKLTAYVLAAGDLLPERKK